MYSGTEFEKEMDYLFCTGCGMQMEYDVTLDTSFDGKLESKEMRIEFEEMGIQVTIADILERDEYKERQAKGNDV